MSQDFIRTNEFYARAFQLGKEEAYDYFFRLYFRSLCFFARRLLHQQYDPKDLVMDCFAKLWQKHRHLQNDKAIRSYLYQTVRNACIDALCKKHYSLISVQEDVLTEDPATAFEDHLIEAELLREIYSTIEQLPDRMKQVVQLYYIEGKKDEEISQSLHTSPHTIRKQRSNAIVILRQKLLARR